jgi:YHS domain-containing protein
MDDERCKCCNKQLDEQTFIEDEIGDGATYYFCSWECVAEERQCYAEYMYDASR